MKILITGVHGFVGRNLVNAWKDKHKIYGLGRTQGDMTGLQGMFSYDDMRQGRLPEVDAIIHLAGKAHDTKNQAGVEVYFKVNTELTKEVYDYFLQSSAQKFVYFSSVKAAANSVKGDVLTEEEVPTPVGPYGESKIKAEDYIQAHPAQDGKSVYVLRPCMIHGPGNKGNLNLLYNVVKHNVPWPLGAFENRRSFLSIQNLIFVTEGLLTQEVPSGIYQVADDESLSTNELISLICSVLGHNPHIWHWNRNFMMRCAKVGDYLHLPLNTERLAKLTENYVVSNGKVKKVLGIERMPVSIVDGMRDTLRSFGQS